MPRHTDLPPGSRRWAEDVDRDRAKLAEMEALVRRMATELRIDPTNPSRDVNAAGDMPRAGKTLQQKLSGLGDTETFNVLDGQVLTWSQTKQRWVPQTPKAGGGTFELTNLFPDPTFRTVGREANLLVNYCTNPTPTLSLAGYEAVGGTITRTAAASIVGMGYGVRVTGGVKLPPAADDAFHHVGHSFYIRAVTAATVTVSMEAGVTGTVRAQNWGAECSWGEDIPRQEPGTNTITLAAGETRRYRIYWRPTQSSQGGTWDGSSDYARRLVVTGTGTFDVDGVCYTFGVDDEQYMVGNDTHSVPGTIPFFCGDSPDDENYTHVWGGEAYASYSYRRVDVPLYWTSTNGADDSFEQTFCATLPGGRRAIGIMAQWNFGGWSGFAPNTAEGEYDISSWLEPDTDYLLAFDLIQPYRTDLNTTEDGRQYRYFEVNTTNSNDGIDGDAGVTPYSTRVVVPFNSGTGQVSFDIYHYACWLSGVFYLTNVSITQEPHYWIGRVENSTSEELECVPGQTVYLQQASYVRYVSGENILSFELFLEAQCGEGGEWLPIAQEFYNEAYPREYVTTRAVVPEDATALRVRNAAAVTTPYNGSVWSWVYPEPEPYFDGDTPEDDLYTYGWLGEPYQSPSKRTPK